jgi:hypothetical protein
MSGLIAPTTAWTDKTSGEHYDRYGPGKKVSCLRLVDRVIQGDLDLRGMTVRGRASLFNVVIEGDLRADEARFLGGFEGRRLIVRGRVLFYSCRFGDIVRIDEGHFHGGLGFDGSDCHSEVVLEGVNVGAGALSFVEARIGGGLELQSSTLSHGLVLDQAQLEGWADLSGMKAKKLSATATVFASGLELRSTQIQGDVKLSDARIKGTTSLRDAKFGGILDARRGIFEGRFDGVRLQCNGIRMAGVEFQREVTLCASNLADLDAPEMTARSSFDLSKSHIAGIVSCPRSEFSGLLNLSEAVIDGNFDVSQSRWQEFHGWRASFNGDLKCDRTTSWGRLNFKEARVDGDGTFDGSIVHGPFELDNSVFERRLDLRLGEIDGTISLADARAAYPTVCLDTFLKAFDGDPMKAADTCLVLRDWLKSQNQYDDMDRASYRLKRLYRQSRSRSFGGFLAAFLEWLFVDLTTGYGLKPWRIVRAIVLVVFIMALLFLSSPEGFERGLDGSLWGALGLSLSRLTGGFIEGVHFKSGHWLETLALMESFFGVFLSALFVGTLTRKLAR